MASSPCAWSTKPRFDQAPAEIAIALQRFRNQTKRLREVAPLIFDNAKHMQRLEFVRPMLQHFGVKAARCVDGAGLKRSECLAQFTRQAQW